MRGTVARIALGFAAVLALSAPAGATAETVRDGDVYVEVTPAAVTLGNDLVERSWSRDAFATTALVDKRRGGEAWSAGHRDFSLGLGAAEIGSEAFAARDAAVERLARGGLRVTMTLVPAAAAGSPAPLTITRVAEAYPGVAGFRTQTTIESAAPLAITSAMLDEAAVGAATPTITAMRGGADWREPGYEGPPLTVGDRHPGTWRESRSAASGEALAGPGEWLSAARGERTLFMAMERYDAPSSRAVYDGELAGVGVEYGRDVASLGPFEEQAHVENPLPELLPGGPAGRFRVVGPGAPLALEPVFTGFGDHDGDEPWQFHRYLTEHRLEPYDRDVTFNSNGTDRNAISTGAKDDVDIATVRRIAPIARDLGVETFILDDGWQAISGDWYPDSPEHPEPRHDEDPVKFAPRFPDPRFEAVRQEIAPMKLGLWMSPMHFNPASETFRRHPEWACTPLGEGTAVYNAADPESGSNEAGIGAWGPDAIPHVEARIREAIESWGVRYFKFDFLHWFDCAGQGDAYEFREEFMAMLDRLRADHPDVTLQVDETNDYRLFPYESVSRGPTWFQNGSPEPDRLLHNLWNLGGYVPSFAIGQHFLGARQWERYPVDTLMAAALPSHLTFFSDLRDVPADVVVRAAEWTRFYREHRALLGGMVYPLLADPLERGWTALQPWDPQRGEGALLAFRQGSDDPARRIALRNVPPGRTFELLEGPTGERVGTATSAELAEGIGVELPEKETARVLVIRALPEPEGTAPTVPEMETPVPSDNAAPGAAGENALQGPPPAPRCVRGTRRGERLRGTAGDDCIAGGRGDDGLSGLAGNDRLTGGPGADAVSCGRGEDVAVVDRGDRVRGCETVRERDQG
ncbi:MAG TPA: alpha-galactosidase [Solirubrobacterales bacterium]